MEILSVIFPPSSPSFSLLTQGKYIIILRSFLLTALDHSSISLEPNPHDSMEGIWRAELTVIKCYSEQSENKEAGNEAQAAAVWPAHPVLAEIPSSQRLQSYELEGSTMTCVGIPHTSCHFWVIFNSDKELSPVLCDYFVCPNGFLWELLAW